MRIYVTVILLALGLALAPAARAAGERAGAFDYYLLALSWTPNWCAAEGDDRRDARCAAGSGIGWALHGLWPQNEVGWPSDCITPQADPSRAETAAMGRFMGSSGLAWHQWRKHGRCSGLSAQDYFLTTARALGRITIPPLFAGVGRDLRLPPAVVEAAFLEANPGLIADMITVTCRGGDIQEVRICLTRELDPRPCGAGVRRDCAVPSAGLDALR
jgi:ribonuclease T2